MLVLFNKPFGVLSQFTDSSTAQSPSKTLSEFVDVPDIYPAGRLDKDSEGLLLLTDNGKLQARIADPKYKTKKTYLVQVERIPSDDALAEFASGLTLKDGPTRPAKIRRIDPPDIWPRTPPIRERKSVPDCWVEITLQEGRNRQVRRMTAAIGHPTLRLIRWRIGDWSLDGLQSGTWRKATS